MPASAAASTSDMPFGTVTSRSLMDSVTVSVSTVAISRPRPRPRPHPRPTKPRPARSPRAPRPPRSPRGRPAPDPPRPPAAAGRAGMPRGTRSRHGRRFVVEARYGAVVRERAAALVDVALELVAEVGDVARHRHRHRVAQWAQAVAEDAVAHVQQQVELALAGRAHLDAADDVHAPARALAAGRALAAALVLVELRDAQGQLHHASAVVDHDDSAGADHRAGGRDRLVVDLRVDLVGHQ